MKVLAENSLTKIGFNKLQEKEDVIFYEKIIDSSDNFMISKDEKNLIHQICIMYDKKKQRIKSFDTFAVDDVEMKLLDKNNELEKQILSMIDNSRVS